MLTFGIITDGKRPNKLSNQIASIIALEVPEYEILIAGNHPGALFLPDLAAAGRLGAMRNAIADAAQGDIVSITDDDIIYLAGWYNGLMEYTGSWDLMCSKMLNPDGTRCWDWVTKGGKRGHILIPYWETDPHLYITGGRIVGKRDVLRAVRWDDQRGVNQEEDIDFTRRAQAQGHKIVMNKNMAVMHDDPRYTSRGNKMYFRSE